LTPARGRGKVAAAHAKWREVAPYLVRVGRFVGIRHRETVMIQYLVVTARNHPDLYGYLRRQFAGDEKVRVLLDRRHEDRRREGSPRKPDRRKGDRRGGWGKDNGLTSHGFVIIRQFAGVQWRPPWWGRDPGEVRSEIEKHAGSAGAKAGDAAKASDARNLVAGWVTEGQRLLGIIPRLLREHEQIAARAGAAERKSARYEEEVRRLRNENEHFRRERRQTAEALKALTRQLIESAGEMPPPRS